MISLADAERAEAACGTQAHDAKAILMSIQVFLVFVCYYNKL
jgi:hypothetical protein